MPINGLNHVNIVTNDLDATAAFYETVLGMTIREIPVAMPGFAGRWICDAHDQPIFHVQAYNPERHGNQQIGVIGSIDHVALTCTDFVGIRARCEALGVEHRVNDRQYANLRQVFVTDPNNIALELNFAGD